jgi:protein involved in polysaccharide export with SLBB domain
MYFENAVSIRGVDSIVLYGLRQVKEPGEFTRNPLGSLILDAISRLLKLSFATEG